MSDNSPLLLLLTLVLLLGGLGYGGNLLFDELNKLKTTPPSATERPVDPGLGQFYLNVPLEPPNTTNDPNWLRIFLGTFEIALDLLSSRLSDEIDRRMKNLDDEENQRRLNDASDDSIKRNTGDVDSKRLPSSNDDPRSRIPVDGDPETRIRSAAAAEDTSRAPNVSENPESRIPVDGDPETRIRSAAAAEDTSRAPNVSENPESRIPVDGDPETRIKNAVDVEDGSRVPLSDDNIRSVDVATEERIKSISNALDLKSQGKISRLKTIFKRPITASLISTDIVEGRVFDSDGRAKPLSDNPNEIKYDSKAAGSFGIGPSTECRETSKGREIIAEELSRTEIESRRTPHSTMLKTAALRAASVAADAVGAVGDVMDVLQIIQVFGNAVYYDPGCEQNPGDPTKCKFPTEFLTANQAKDISRLVVKKQIDLLASRTPKDPDFKPIFPLIRGPLDVLLDDPYMNQTLNQLEVNAVENRILSGDPWRSKFLSYFGNQTTLDEIVNDPSDSLSYYTADVGMTNQEIDSVYEQAFTAVCLHNRGKIWKDTYASGRPRFQCGFTKQACEIAREQYFTSWGKGNYVEWYTYTDIQTLLASTTPPLAPALNFTSKPSDEDGFCMVSSPGTASICKYYKGNYDISTHSCQFSKEYCQSIGSCHNSYDKTCYLPSKEMEALNFFFAGGGVREWIKVNGCTFTGTATDAQKAEFATQSVLYTFLPFTMMYTPNGRRMFQDAIANSRNWAPGIKAQLNDPMIGVSFASAIVGLGTQVAIAAGFASSGVGLPIAAVIMAAVLVTLGVTMIEAEQDKNESAKVDHQDIAFMGLQKVGDEYAPTSRGYSSGWVTRKLPVTRKADGSTCTAVENYRNPSVCYEVTSTADIPQVSELPFARKKYSSVDSTLRDLTKEIAGIDLALSFEWDYKNKTQCWKHDILIERANGAKQDAYGNAISDTLIGKAKGTVDSNNKIYDGYIRAGTYGADNKTWCIERRPTTAFFDSTFGTPAAESEYSMNRSWTSKYGDTGIYYPEYPGEAARLSATLHNHFRYQLVYDKDSIPVATMWDDLLMDVMFTETTVAEIRRYYCEQELIKFSSDTSRIDKRCFGYLSLDVSGYTWFAMSLPGRVLSTFNTITGTVTMGTPTTNNRDNKCAIKYGLNFEEDSKGLCYLNCNYGTGATNDNYAYVSRNWKSDSATMCYKQYPKWEDNGRGHGEQTITKKIFVSTYQGGPNSCPSGKEEDNGLCYRTCASLDPNLDTTKYEYLDDGGTQCYKHHKYWEDEASYRGRPAGTGPRTTTTMNKPSDFQAKLKGTTAGGDCADTYENVAGICYSKCASNQIGVGPLCHNKNCPSGTTERTQGLCMENCRSDYFFDDWLAIPGLTSSGIGLCYSNCPTNYARSAPGMCQENCHSISYSGLSAPTKKVTAGICSAYDFSCPSSYDRTGVGTSTPTCYRPPASRLRSETCPVDYNKNGSLCEKKQYGVGPGTPKECQRTQAGLCHSLRPWRCGGNVRVEIDTLCYNPCQPAFNSGMTCPTGSTNNSGYCERPITQWTPWPYPSWWNNGAFRCPQRCTPGGSFQYYEDVNCGNRYNCGYEGIWGYDYSYGDEPTWSYSIQYTCSTSYVCDQVLRTYTYPTVCEDVRNPDDPRYYDTSAQWCAGAMTEAEINNANLNQPPPSYDGGYYDVYDGGIPIGGYY